jgi:diacylglycerol kinase family enzyme
MAFGITSISIGVSNGIEHIPGKKISLTTDPAMKVDIDGEISLETPIDIEDLFTRYMLNTLSNFIPIHAITLFKNII